MRTTPIAKRSKKKKLTDERRECGRQNDVGPTQEVRLNNPFDASGVLDHREIGI